MKAIQSLASFAMVLFFFLSTIVAPMAGIWFLLPLTILCLNLSLNLFVQIHNSK
jgi:hypothetical protein